MRSPSFSSYRSDSRPAREKTRFAQGVADYLQADDKMAALIPAVTRIAALQKDCTTILPAVFDSCAVLRLDADQLTLSAPSSALAAKLKQQLPKLQTSLLKLGWQVSAIRIKVQLGNISERKQIVKQLTMPDSAVSALAALHDSLGNSPHNETLRTALAALVQRHRAGK